MNFQFVVIFLILFEQAWSANMACQEVRYAYSAKGMNVYDVPLKPQSGVSLRICPTGPTCCTPDMEERLNDWSAAQYREALSRKTDEMATPFRNKASKLDDFMSDIFGDSQRQFHNTFSQTYGHLYERNAFIFRDYFQELRKHYERGNENLFETTNRLFTKK
jgi:glypican 6